MADISKIKLANGTVLDLKDASVRSDLQDLLSSLKSAAYKDAAAAITDTNGKLASAEMVKNYVDAQVGTIHNFDVRVYTTLPTASASTMYIIGLIQDDQAEAGTYVEYITVRSGTEGSYTYAWEKIGSTKTDLSGYVPNTRKVAGIMLNADISVSALQEALELGSLAYVNDVTGSTTLDTIDTITMKPLTVAGNATVTSTNTTATISKKDDYTPAGTITGSAISGGSINVTLKDATTATEATLSTETYTPTGTVTATEGGNFSALKSATFAEITGSETGGVQIGGTVSKPNITLTSSSKNVATGLTGGSVASFTEGTFTPASLGTGFYTVGSAATLTGQSYTPPTLGDASTSKFAKAGITAAVGTGTDAETLIFSNASTEDAVTAQGTLSNGIVNFGTFNGGAPTVIDVSKFDGGSKAPDSFTANTLQEASVESINNVTAAALAAAPTFTGKSYKINTTADTALKTVEFTATNSAAVVNKVEYKKQAIDAKTFTPVAATLGFSGTTVEDLIPSEIKYDKANATAAFSKSVTPEVQSYDRTAKTIEITSTPNT